MKTIKIQTYLKCIKNPIWLRKMVIWMMIVVMTTQPVLVSAEVVVDANAPGKNRPTIENSASNLPIVQITAPTAAGVSRNFYQQFNVDSHGLILNNSRMITQTQLAGYITGNPNLANGSARIILNEVTGNNPSYLRGYTEVAGQKAEVIIANPNGIYGDGFGFINTSRAVLTTGTPVFGGSGSLDAFRVTGGQIAIQGAGMNANQVDQVDLISRSVAINAGIWTKNLNLVAGSNKVGYDTLHTEVISGDAKTSSVAIDVGQLGGMYAQKIYMVGTENGVGVNSKGTIAAQVGDITINSAGKVLLAGNTSAAGDIHVTATDDVTNQNSVYAQGNSNIISQGRVDNSGTIAAGKNTILTAQNITSTGILGAGVKSNGTLGSTGDLILNATGAIGAYKQNMAANNLVITGQTVALANSKTQIGGKATIISNAGDIDNSGAVLQVNRTLDMKATGILRNQGGLIQANDDITIATEKFSGANGTITAGQDVNITTNQDFVHDVGSRVQANRDVKITATGTVKNQGSIIAVRNTNIIGEHITNTTGAVITANAATDIKAVTGNVTNNGQIQGTAITITAGQDVTNTGSVMGDTVKVKADAIFNNGATAIIATTGSTNLYASRLLENKDGANIYSMSNLNIAGSDKIDSITGEYTDRTSSVLNQSATIQAENNISIFANNLTNKKREFLFEQQTVSTESYMGGIRPPTPGDRWENEWLVFWRWTSAIVLTGNRGAIPSDWLIERTITQPVILKDSPAAQITAGKNIYLRANNLTNEMSNIMATGELSAVTQNFSNTNTAFFAKADKKKILTVHDRQQYENQERDFATAHDDITYQPILGYSSIVSGGQTVTINTGTLNNSTIQPGTAPTAKVEFQQPTVGQIAQGNNANLILPTNMMFTINTQPNSHYLVETNPRFANYKNFVSSDYMLKQLDIKPEQIGKRIGDAFYEQKLVREQVTELTGRAYLSNYSDSNEQYKALLNNGLTYGKKFELVVGVALTADQMTKLTSDMVWMVEKEVSGQKVLVPEVYLSQLHIGDLKPDGAVVIGDHVIITATGDVNNAGIIKGTTQVTIDAANIINNGGSIDGGKTTRLEGAQDVVNRSGLISGDKVELIAGRDVKNETFSYTDTQSALQRTSIGNIAAINGENITIKAGQDVSLIGATVSATKDVTITADRNLNVGAVQTEYRLEAGQTFVDKVYNIGSSIEAGGNVNITAKKDAVLRGAEVKAKKELNLNAGGNVEIAAVKDKEIEDKTIWVRDNFTRTRSDDEAVVGTSLQGGTQVSIIAGHLPGSTTTNSTGGNITVSGSYIGSDQGKIELTADKNAIIQDVTEKHEKIVQTHTQKDGFFSSTTTDTLDSSLINQVKGSTVSGDTVTATSGKDLTIQGSSVIGTKDVNLIAANNVNIVSAKETGKDEHFREERTSGIFSGGGLGFTIGSKSEKTTTNDQTLDEIGSTIGSIKGNVTITAGDKVNSAGTTFVAEKDLSITGKDVTIDNTVNNVDSQYKYEFKQTGLSVSLGGGIVGAATSAYNDINRSTQVQDDRLKALYDYKAVKDIQKLGDYKGNLKKDLGIIISFGSTQTTTEQTSHTETVNASNINAGGNVTIKATTGDVNLQGTNIDAKDITLDAKNNINIDSGENKQQTTSNTSSSSWSVGGTVGVGFNASASKGSGSENEKITTNAGSVINATGTLTLKSGDDTNITGSKVKGDKVVANIGGDLNIASVQDTDNYTAKNQSMGVGVSTGQTGPKDDKKSIGGTTGSFNTGKTNSNYASVTDQAGIFAGKDGFDITVGKNTDLKGAVIASEAEAIKNALKTGTLTFSNMENRANYNSSSTGRALNTKPDAKYYEQGLTPIASMPVSGDASSTTKSAISPGTITITGNQTQDLSGLSRDTTNSLNTLGEIFDKQTVKERQELAGLFGQLAFEEVHKISEKNGWNDGDPQKVALHTLVGGIMSELTGSGFISGAKGAGFNEIIQKQLSNITDPAIRQWASYIIGSAVTGTVGGIAGLYGTKYNDLLTNIIAIRDAMGVAYVIRSMGPGALLQLFKYYGIKKIEEINTLTGGNLIAFIEDAQIVTTALRGGYSVPDFEVVGTMRQLKIYNDRYDCSEIADDLYKAANGKGEILVITSNTKYQDIVVSQFGKNESYINHYIYSDGTYVYDPRYSSTPILKKSYLNLINELNDGNVRIDVER